mmetsp:Transcript_7937/g.15755  ORF Transcript_7937/g.15755 Transcript_7937/m.15755 type:complete len:81 (-) Transcript_7937:943-1185(-)
MREGAEKVLCTLCEEREAAVRLHSEAWRELAFFVDQKLLNEGKKAGQQRTAPRLSTAMIAGRRMRPGESRDAGRRERRSA